jgi:ABC-type nitrate/sulfonate/bicarbonate transport system substrate-binding protein
MNKISGWISRLVVAAIALTAFDHTASAADKVRAAKSADVAFTQILLDIGVREGIFAKYNLDVEVSALAGDAKVQQALTADSIDFGLGGGPSMAFTAKGAPVIAVAAFAAEPRNIAIVVGMNSPLKTAKDLKGKLIAVTTVGSLTDWFVHHLSVQEGWGPDGVRTTALGSFAPALAALKTGQVDGVMASVETAYGLEERGEGKLLVGMKNYAPNFITHVIFARKDLVNDNPDLVARFLKGFFASVAFEKANKEKSVEIAMDVLHQSKTAMSHSYDDEIAMFEDDGHFDPTAVAVIKDSLADMKMLPEKPTDDQLFTTKFTPVKP